MVLFLLRNFLPTYITYFRYLEVLLRRASTGQLIYSDHLQVFIANTDTPQVPFTAERYTDARGWENIFLKKKWFWILLG